MRFATGAVIRRKSMSRPGDRERIGFFLFGTTASALNPNLRSKSLQCLSVYTLPRTIPAPEWDLRFANASSNESGGESGWSRNPDVGRRSSLRYPSESGSELRTDRKDSRILVVEHNPADAGLVRRALEEHGIGGELTVFADGENAIQFIQALDTEPT